MTGDQVTAWREALAKHHATQRRNRGRRSTDAYARALPVAIKLPPRMREQLIQTNKLTPSLPRLRRTAGKQVVVLSTPACTTRHDASQSGRAR